MYDDNLKIAYDRSNEFLDKIGYNSGMLDTSKILECVKQLYCSKVYLSTQSFKNLNLQSHFGAMMLVKFDSIPKDNTPICDQTSLNQPTEATIILNSDNPPIFQRFSLLHELGHLATMNEASRNLRSNPDTYIISTHIDYNVTSISEDVYKNNDYLLNEQIANIFALRVLMPSSLFYAKVQELNNISSVADYFGVTEDAVVSRMRIGE